MIRIPMLMRRGHTYYARIHVPLDLQPSMRKKEIWKSLRTSSLPEAQVLCLTVTAQMLKVFETTRRRLKNPFPSPVEVAQSYESRFREEAKGDQGDEDALEMVYSSALQEFADHVDQGDLTGLNKLLDRVLVEEGLHVSPSKRPEFLRALLHSHLAALRERAGGVSTGPTVNDLTEAYLKERKLNSKSDDEVRRGFSRFVGVVGNKPAKDVTKEDVRRYREALFSKQTARGSTLAPNSIKRLLGICGTVFRHGVAQGLLESSPFEGMMRVVRKTEQTTRRVPYSVDDLRLLFQSEAFGKLTGARRWLPLLSAYTGARVEELGGLRVQDVREEQGITFLAFEPTTERRLKNEGSRRRVPVHPELLRLGFMAHIASRPPGGLLFDLKPGPHGKLTGAFGQWYHRFTSALGLTDPTKVFHSYRHTFKSACREAGIPEEVHDALTGHTSGSVGRTYGRGPSLAVLADAMNKIRLGIEG